MIKYEKIRKISLFKRQSFGYFLKDSSKSFNELSDKQTMLCCCGRLATGLHENNCTKFNNKVDAETIKLLSHLLPKGK